MSKPKPPKEVWAYLTNGYLNFSNRMDEALRWATTDGKIHRYVLADVPAPAPKKRKVKR